jgi:hypothetical protein
MVSKKDMGRYSDALEFFTEIIRTRGYKNTVQEIIGCLKEMEYFEEYEKCKSLSEIIKMKENVR